MLQKYTTSVYYPGTPAAPPRAASRTCPPPSPPVSGTPPGNSSSAVVSVVVMPLYGAPTPNQAAEAAAIGWPAGQVGYIKTTYYSNGTSSTVYVTLPA